MLKEVDSSAAQGDRPDCEQLDFGLFPSGDERPSSRASELSADDVRPLTWGEKWIDPGEWAFRERGVTELLGLGPGLPRRPASHVGRKRVARRRLVERTSPALIREDHRSRARSPVNPHMAHHDRAHPVLACPSWLSTTSRQQADQPAVAFRVREVISLAGSMVVGRGGRSVATRPVLGPRRDR
jgi:hypothetical protein